MITDSAALTAIPIVPELESTCCSSK